MWNKLRSKHQLLFEWFPIRQHFKAINKYYDPVFKYELCNVWLLVTERKMYCFIHVQETWYTCILKVYTNVFHSLILSWKGLNMRNFNWTLKRHVYIICVDSRFAYFCYIFVKNLVKHQNTPLVVKCQHVFDTNTQKKYRLMAPLICL